MPPREIQPVYNVKGELEDLNPIHDPVAWQQEVDRQQAVDRQHVVDRRRLVAWEHRNVVWRLAIVILLLMFLGNKVIKSSGKEVIKFSGNEVIKSSGNEVIKSSGNEEIQSEKQRSAKTKWDSFVEDQETFVSGSIFVCLAFAMISYVIGRN